MEADFERPCAVEGCSGAGTKTTLGLAGIGQESQSWSILVAIPIGSDATWGYNQKICRLMKAIISASLVLDWKLQTPLRR